MSAIRAMFGIPEPARVGQIAALRDAENRVNVASDQLEATLREKPIEPLEDMIEQIRGPEPRRRSTRKRSAAR
jgi:hypothetical protein